MKTRALLIVVALLVGSCGGGESDGDSTSTNGESTSNNSTMGTTDGDDESPQVNLPDFECAGETIVGTAEAGELLREHGVFEVAYDLDPITNDMTFELRDEEEGTVATIDVATRLEDIVTATASLVIEDGAGDVKLTERSRVQFIPGLGSRIEMTRTAGGETVELWDVVTSDRAVGGQEIAVAADDFAGTPDPAALRRTLSGEYQVFTTYDPETEEFASKSAIDAWAAEAGVTAPVSGEWKQLLAATFGDEKWRLIAMAHFTTCQLGEQTLVSTFQGLQTVSPDDDSRSVRQALSCAEEEEIRETQRFISEKLDTLSHITGTLGDATIKGVIIANADKLGVKGTHEIPGFGTITITPGDINTAASLLQGLGKGAALGVLMTNPVGLGLAGVTAWSYVAARVNDAFGDHIIRYWKERKNRKALEEAQEAEAERKKRQAAEKNEGASWLDPHLRTFDGGKIDFQAEGDFILARATSGSPLEVHVRQLPRPGNCDDVTYNWGVATRVGQVRVSDYADDPHQTIRLDGELYDVPRGGALFLEGGGMISATGSSTVVTYPSGETVVIGKKRDVRLNIYVNLNSSRSGSMEGLLGNFDGNPDDDLRNREGRVFEEPVAWDEIYGEFREAWLVSADESLLDYEAEETPEDFFNADMPIRPMTVDDLLPEDVDRARGVCEEAGVSDPVILDSCILDVVCMGDDEEAEVSATQIPPVKAIDVERPIFLDGWTVEGPPANGNWEVAEDGRSVEQTVNGNPTFFVSPQNYRDVTISGAFGTDNGDDDYIGFVFGYNGPFEAEGDDPNEFDFLLLGWKQFLQGEADPGFTLARVRGNITDYNPGFWAQTSSPEYEILATDYGAGRGWTTGRAHGFELSYGADRVRVAVSGRQIFDLSAADAGLAEFPDGRFGFYNYSQPRVTYSDFGVVDGARSVGVDEFSIDDFSRAVDDISLVRHATIDGPLLRLTGVGRTAGNGWHKAKVMVRDGFTTDFTFRISNPDAAAGRGFAFVIQNENNALNAVGNGNATGALGYDGIAHSVAVEFDTQQEAFDPDVPHVSVQTRYEAPNTADHAASLGSAGPDVVPVFDDGAVHWARITYDGTELRVFLDDSTTPVLTTPIDLSTMRFDEGHAHIGFSAQAESIREFDIVSWSYSR